MPSVDVDGVAIHYEIDGDPAAPPLGVLHGGLGIDHVLYRRTLAPLADDHRVVHYDQRGNGRSWPADVSTISMARLADDVVALADVLGIDRFAVLGHSYGGFVAQELALRHGDRLTAMVLVDTTPGQLGAGEVEGEHGVGPPMPPEVAAKFSQPPPTTDEGMEVWMADALPGYFHRPEQLDLAALAAGTVYRTATMVQGFAVLSSWSSVDRLRGVTVPTLVVAGRHDVVTAWPQALRIGARIPGAEVVILEESGHFPWIEEPDAFFALVRRFLS